MIAPKAQTQPRPKIVVDPKHDSGAVATMPDKVPSPDKIRERAYELFEGRGREPGREEQDWLRAEKEILKRRR